MSAAASPSALVSGRTTLLWLLDSLNLGGAEGLAVPFARNLDRRRWDLRVACLTSIGGNPVEALLRAEGVPVFHAGARNLRDLAAFRRLLAFVRNARVDLVHAHLTDATIWGALAARRTGIPLVSTLHVAPPDRGVRARMRDRLMRTLLGREPARVVAVSNFLRERYAAAGLDPRRTLVVHNGIEVERFAGAGPRRPLLASLDVPRHATVAVTVSVLRPEKGIDVLIEAARELPETWFVVVGTGPMEEPWRRLAAARGVGDRIRWTGYRSDVSAILGEGDLFVLPTLADAFPTALLEAMAAGLPVVASDVGGVPEIVLPGVTGLLTRAGDPAALASAIRELAGDTARRGAMGKAARARAVSQFSTTAWIRRLEAVYEEALA